MLIVELIFLVFLLFNENKILIFYLLLFVAIIHIVTEYLKNRINRANMLAFKFDKLLILNSAYDKVTSNFELANLKTESLVFDKKLKECLYKKSSTINADFNIKDFSNPNRRLLSMLQENAFWNHTLYKEMYLKKRSIVFYWIFIPLFILILILPALINLYILSIPTPPTEPTNFFNAPYKIIFVLLSFGLLYEFVDEMLNYNRASKEMLELDNEITRIYEKVDNTDSAMSLLVKYHYTKALCPYISDDVYERNKDGLNKAWDFRVMNSLKDSVKKIARFLKEMEEPWVITGGASLYMRGCKEKTHDIDIITTQEGVKEVSKKLKSYQPIKKTEADDKNLKSYFSLAKIGGRDVDIMGDPEVKIDGEWQKLNWLENIEKVNIDDVKIPFTNIGFEKKTQTIIHDQKMYSLEEKCRLNSVS